VARQIGRPDGSTPGVPEQIDTKTGTGTDAFSAVIDFDKPCIEVIFFSEDAGAIFQTTYDGTNWTDDIIIPKNFMLGMEMAAQSFKVKNKVAGAGCSYTIMGRHYA